MIIKLLIMIGLMVVSVPAMGVIGGIISPVIGTKRGENFVYLGVLVAWGVIIYMVWIS